MRNETFTIVDENGFELLVNADLEIFDGNREECHGFHSFPSTATIDIKSVELIIASTGINITDLLDKKQLKAIEDEIINQLAVAA